MEAFDEAPPGAEVQGEGVESGEFYHLLQAAAAIGIAEQHYQRFEGGVNLPNIENAWRLADHFGVSTDYLVGRSEER